MKPNNIISDQIRLDQTKSDQKDLDLIRPDQINSDQSLVNSDQI